jgi:predicted sugar kinase
MFGQASPMPEDKIMRLFIIQAISSFVSRDYDSGLHYLNEIKTGYAQYMSQMNPTLKGLVKEIIQALDMMAPGASSDSFATVNTSETTVEADQPVEQQGSSSGSGSVTNELQDLLDRRRARRKNR